jgi:hypothetical protein
MTFFVVTRWNGEYSEECKYDVVGVYSILDKAVKYCADAPHVVDICGNRASKRNSFEIEEWEEASLIKKYTNKGK